MPDFTDSVWTRPPRASKSEQPALSRAQIVRTAVTMLDEEGLAGLSMRRLGVRLGSGATSAYWHVGNKDDLLELVADEVLGEVYVPEATDVAWREGLRIMAESTRAAFVRHPWVVPLLGVRPTIGPNAMRMTDRSVALLTAGGFGGVAVTQVMSLVMSYSIGAATTETAVAAAVKRSGKSTKELVLALEPLLESRGAELPNYDRWRRENEIGRMDPDKAWNDSYGFGLERLLDGLELWLNRQKT